MRAAQVVELDEYELDADRRRRAHEELWSEEALNEWQRMILECDGSADAEVTR